MATGPRSKLFIDEWFAKKGANDESVGKKLNRDRTTIWKWRRERHRLDPDKIDDLAWALGIKARDFYRHPDDPSLDSIVEGADQEQRNTAVDIVKRLLGRS